LDKIFKIKSFEKKPIKGGTPAKENMDIDRDMRKKLSKL
jgi:hypothetical protein